MAKDKVQDKDMDMDKDNNMGKDEETNLSLPGAFFGRSASKGTHSVW